MSYSTLVEKLTLNELNYKATQDAQKSIVRLFPPFNDRKKKVANNGGTKLIKIEPDIWTFSVASGDKKRHEAGVSYIVRVFFDSIEDTITKSVEHRGNWTKDGKHLNLNAVGAWCLNHCDISTSCSTTDGSFGGREPSSQFWGMNYIKTGKGAELDHDEQRSPNIRNPHKDGLLCKHCALVLDNLQFYGGTFASSLKKYFSKFVLELEKKVLSKRFNSKPTPKVEPKEENPVNNVKPKSQEPIKKLSPAQDQQEEQWKKGENPNEEDENDLN